MNKFRDTKGTSSMICYGWYIKVVGIAIQSVDFISSRSLEVLLQICGNWTNALDILLQLKANPNRLSSTTSNHLVWLRH